MNPAHLDILYPCLAPCSFLLFCPTCWSDWVFSRLFLLDSILPAGFLPPWSSLPSLLGVLGSTHYPPTSPPHPTDTACWKWLNSFKISPHKQDLFHDFLFWSGHFLICIYLEMSILSHIICFIWYWLHIRQCLNIMRACHWYCLYLVWYIAWF